MYSPCKNCQERKLYCHSTCEKYLAFTEERQFVLAKRKEEAEIRSAACQKHFEIKKRQHLL